MDPVTAPWRRTLALRRDGAAWGASLPVERPPGLTTVGAGAWVENPESDTAVVLEGTALHPDAPAAGWALIWSATVGDETPAATSGPLFLGAVRWVRWRLSTPSAPSDDSVLHLAVDGDTPE